jgi:hypothetical protein
MIYDGKEVEFIPTLASIEDYLGLLVSMSENQELSRDETAEILHVLHDAYNRVMTARGD